MNRRQTSTMQKIELGNKKPLAKEDDYQKNVNLSVQWSRWFLKLIGAWPKSSNASRIEKYLNWFANVICYSSISFLFIPCSTFLYFEEHDTYNRIRLIGPLSFFLMALFKYHLLLIHEDDIRECTKQIEFDWKNIKHEDDKHTMTTNAIYGRRLVVICTCIMYSAFVFYYIASPISVGRVLAEDTNLTFIPTPFPFSMHIIDYRHSPINEVLFIIQVLTGAAIHSIIIGACSAIAMFAVHACGQMEILMCWLEHLINGRMDIGKTVDHRIANIVDQHVRILKFLALIEKVYQQISFVEFLGSTMNMCLLGYYIIKEWNPKDLAVILAYMVLLSSFTFNVFIFCYIGELVAEQCRKVGETSYMIEWYRLTGKKKLCCVLIISMSNSSIKLTAGNMIELSISAFSDVVKTSVGFLNILRAMI